MRTEKEIREQLAKTEKFLHRMEKHNAKYFILRDKANKCFSDLWRFRAKKYCRKIEETFKDWDNARHYKQGLLYTLGAGEKI